MTFLRALLASAVLIQGATHASAASQDDVARLANFIRVSPKAKTEGYVSHVDAIIERDSNEAYGMRFQSQRFRLLTRELDGKQAVGIRGVYVIGAAESNYNLDTSCTVVFTTFGSGALDQQRWDCEAWTPTQDEFVKNHGQRVFDGWVQMALRHFEKK